MTKEYFLAQARMGSGTCYTRNADGFLEKHDIDITTATKEQLDKFRKKYRVSYEEGLTIARECKMRGLPFYALLKLSTETQQTIGMKYKFEVGVSYLMFSPADNECKWMYDVIKRTEKTVTLKQFGTGKVTTHRITTRKWTQKGMPMEEEMVYPLGKSSLCPVLGATSANKG